jgi:RNA polymerase sigma-70 factor (ECF subfamily)
MQSTKQPSDELALAHYQDVYRFSYSLCLSPSDAQDITQQTFMKFVVHRHTIQEPSKIRSWLLTTAHREFLHQRRKVVRFPHTSLEEAGAENIPAKTQTEQSIDAHQVVSALEQIEENLRAPLTLFYLKDMRYREIAEVLGLPIGTVMSRLSRAKVALRAALGVDEPEVPQALTA